MAFPSNFKLEKQTIWGNLSREKIPETKFGGDLIVKERLRDPSMLHTQ